MADNQPDTTQNDVENSKIRTLELQKKYGIERDAFYARTRYLRITTWKEGGKAYLDVDQIVHMDGLHEHIQQTGRMQGYSVPEPSGPIEEEQPAPTTTLAVAETQQITAPSYAPKQQRSQSSPVDDVAAIVTIAILNEL